MRPVAQEALEDRGGGGQVEVVAKGSALVLVRQIKAAGEEAVRVSVRVPAGAADDASREPNLGRELDLLVVVGHLASPQALEVYVGRAYCPDEVGG